MIFFLKKEVKKVFSNTEILTFGEMVSSLVAPDDQCCYHGDMFPQMHLGQQAGMELLRSILSKCKSGQETGND